MTGKRRRAARALLPALILAALAGCEEEKLPEPPPGLASMATRDGHFGFNFGINRGCTFGRGNLITLDHKPGQEPPPLLLTVEAAAGKPKVYLARDVTLKTLRKGLKIPFDLAKADKRAPLGLYLCGDGRHARSCREKPVLDLGTMSTFFATKSLTAKAPGLPLGQEKLYFFQLFIGAQGRVYYLSPDVQQKQYDAVHQYIKKTLKDDQGADQLIAYMSDVDSKVAFPVAKPLTTKSGLPFFTVSIDERDEAHCEAVYKAKVDAHEAEKSTHRPVVVRPPPTKRQTVKPPN